MSEIAIEGWSVQRETEGSVLLTSSKGEVAVNRWRESDHFQTWFADLELDREEPKSWKITVTDRDELFGQELPRLLDSN